MSTVKNYLSLVKFSHTIFALPFALIGFFLGLFSTSIFHGWDETHQLSLNRAIGWNLSSPLMLRLSIYSKWYLLYLFILMTLCMIFARSAAMSFNRYLDANFDAKNPRTAMREIPAGVLKKNNVLLFTLANCLLFIACCFFINRICFYLSPLALFVVLFYSYTKRFTALCHLVLGIGLSLAPIGAYLAVTGSFNLLPILFSFTVLCWVSGFDIIYALQDEAFDKAQNLHSIPAALGKTKALRISGSLHLLAAASVMYAGIYGHFGNWYWTGVALFTGLLIYQHLLVKPTDLSKVNVAFFTTNGIASVLFAVFVILDLFLNK
jgi:4-hydroxybenzoate polyprenyltransferase